MHINIHYTSAQPVVLSHKKVPAEDVIAESAALYQPLALRDTQPFATLAVLIGTDDMSLLYPRHVVPLPSSHAPHT
jgi:hypothetical protein